MMYRKTAVALVGALAASRAYAAPSCGPNNNCPSDTPCCSQYGQCGVGAYCLGGCDPLYSHSLESCVAAPICSSEDYKLTSLDGIMANTEYLGDPGSANWVSSGQPVAYNNDSVLLTMAPSTVGTLLTSTKYVWYGKISATLSTSQGQGVVTAFIMMSDVKDEIDFEFVGADVQSAQSNYYFQGELDYNNELNLSTSDTRQNTHTYTIDWSTDQIIWSIDGKSMRTVKRSDTWNATTNQYHYPQTPSRIELSLWPAGLQSNGEGTVAWSGGLVDWNSPYMQNGYYYATVSDVSVQCYDPPQGYNNSGNKAYIYSDNAGINSSIATVNDDTTLQSFSATGENPGYNPGGSSSSKGAPSATGSNTPATSGVETVPGVSGAGAQSEGGSPAQGNSGGGSSGGAGAGGSGGSGFSQGTGQPGSSGADSLKGQRLSAVEGGSLVAFVVAVIGLMVL